MDKLEFIVNDDHDVVLPATLANGKLSLEEIGMIFLMFASFTGAVSFDTSELYKGDTERILNSLKERGIFDVEFNDGKLDIILNIEDDE